MSANNKLPVGHERCLTDEEAIELMVGMVRSSMRD